MSGLSQNPGSTVPKEKEVMREVHSIPHEFEYFKSLVVGNRKDLFFFDTEDKTLKEEHLRTDYGLLMSHLEMYKETISDEYPGYADFDFLKGYVQKIYQALYSESPLTSVFENPETQEQFFTLMQKYIFESFGRKHLELTEQFRRPEVISNLSPNDNKQEFLTQEEKESLLKEYDMPEEEQKRLGIWVDEDNK